MQDTETTAQESATYTVKQVADANEALRALLAIPTKEVGVEDFVKEISVEIHDVRLAGHSDSDIASVLAAAGIEIEAESITKYFCDPT